MLYDEIKVMLKKRYGREGSKSFHVRTQIILKKSEDFLSHISLRKYFERLDLATLLLCTDASKNWLYFGDVDLDMISDGCQRASEKMRNDYGMLYCGTEDIPYPEMKELVSWCALFPDKEKELLKTAFKAMYDEDEDDMCALCPPEKSVVFTPGFGCATGDELPLPTMVQALRASILIRLIEEGEEELVPFLFAE